MHGATTTGGVAASRAMIRLSRQRRSAASRSESASVARSARREARAPAGQLKNTAPSRSAAGKSASSENPAHLQRTVRTAIAPAIVTDRPRRQGRLGAASPHGRASRNRARCGLARRCKNAHLDSSNMGSGLYDAIDHSDHAALRSWAIF